MDDRGIDTSTNAVGDLLPATHRPGAQQDFDGVEAPGSLPHERSLSEADVSARDRSASNAAEDPELSETSEPPEDIFKSPFAETIADRGAVAVERGTVGRPTLGTFDPSDGEDDLTGQDLLDEIAETRYERSDTLDSVGSFEPETESRSRASSIDERDFVTDDSVATFEPEGLSANVATGFRGVDLAPGTTAPPAKPSAFSRLRAALSSAVARIGKFFKSLGGPAPQPTPSAASLSYGSAPKASSSLSDSSRSATSVEPASVDRGTLETTSRHEYDDALSASEGHSTSEEPLQVTHGKIELATLETYDGSHSSTQEHAASDDRVREDVLAKAHELTKERDSNERGQGL